MKKALATSLAVASVFLIAGALLSKFDTVWAEAVGLLGVLVVMFCLGIAVAEQAIDELEGKKGNGK